MDRGDLPLEATGVSSLLDAEPRLGMDLSRSVSALILNIPSSSADRGSS